jgi:hypothetical protein
VLAGREFEGRDDATARPVAIVNSTLAERFWGGRSQAIGRRLRVSDEDWRTVVGVVADIKYLRINEPPRPYVYLPYLQAYRPVMNLHTRGASASAFSIDALVERARALVVSLDSDLPLLQARPLANRINGALILFNLTATMLFVFGVAGMALAAMGTYGLVSYSVKQSTHEIGIRMALGATGVSIIRGFLARGLRLGVLGSVVGIVTAFIVSRLLSGVLFGVSATDATSFTQALAVVLSGVLLATVVPAWRASRTDPVRALRHQ